MTPDPDAAWPDGLTRRLSRRGLLIGGGAIALGAGAVAVGVEEGVLPGRSWVFRNLGLDGTDGAVPRVRAGRTISGSFTSEARRGESTGWSIALPPGHGHGLPRVVVLHGRGNDHSDAFSPDFLALDRFLTVVVAHGATPFALASVDGGESYWHARDSGEDAGAMVIDEFLPLLARHSLDITRVGFLGWSMGGYGALRLAGLLGPERVAGVVAESPALWREYADSAPGAFDDEADFTEHSVIGRQASLDGIPVRIDCGEGDPFYGATQEYVEGFDSPPAGGFQRGDHDIGYWRRMAPVQLRFLAGAFAT